MSNLPEVGVGLVLGIEATYRVDWVNPDLAYLVDPTDEQVVFEFASANDGGFISQYDVLGQAHDIVANWDAEAL